MRINADSGRLYLTELRLLRLDLTELTNLVKFTNVLISVTVFKAI